MGDIRNESVGQRAAAIGMIDKRYLLGHVLLRVFPISTFGKVS
jgi:signal peptidase I